jgi:aminopeptidase N
MSSYLAAWVVAPDDFGYIQTTTQRGKTVRVFARKDAVNAGLVDFALNLTKLSIDFYENQYFDPTLGALPPKIGSII